MATGLSGDGHRQLRRLFAPGTVGGLTDAELLERFATRRDEAAEVAFEALVARHGPMVYRACRALLRDPRDAEDAFQATFLVLARKADRVGAGGPLGPWLHGVARKVALKARAVSARRGRREGGLDADPPADGDAGPCPDLAPTLHEELGRLPEKYRRPVVLCHLEGLTHAEAAQELGWPVGTVSVRSSRARDLLRQRLARRGLAPDASSIVPALLAGATPPIETLVRIASAAPPPAIMAASAGALAYGKGSTPMMLLSFAKWLMIPLAVGIGAAVTTQSTRPMPAASPAATERPPRPATTSLVSSPADSGRSPFSSDVPPTPAGGRSQPDPDPEPKVEARTGPIELRSGEAPKLLGDDIPIPDGYFDLPVPDPKDGPAPEPVKPGQVLVVEVLEALPGRPITGERVVRPDGTISLGFYGNLRVAGLDRDQIKVRLIMHLRRFLNDDTLGLILVNPKTGKYMLEKPVNITRVFVDDSADQYPDRLRGRPAAGGDELRARIDNLEQSVRELRAIRTRIDDLEQSARELRATRRNSGPAAAPR